MSKITILMLLRKNFRIWCLWTLKTEPASNSDTESSSWTLYIQATQRVHKQRSWSCEHSSWHQWDATAFRSGHQWVEDHGQHRGGTPVKLFLKEEELDQVLLLHSAGKKVAGSRDIPSGTAIAYVAFGSLTCCLWREPNISISMNKIYRDWHYRYSLWSRILGYPPIERPEIGNASKAMPPTNSWCHAA